MSYSMAWALNTTRQKSKGYTAKPKVGDKITVHESIHDGDDGDGEFTKIVIIKKITKSEFGLKLDYGKLLNEYPFLEKGEFIKLAS